MTEPMACVVKGKTVAPEPNNSNAKRQVDDMFLLGRARRGDDLSQSRLILRYQPLIRQTASRYFLTGGDRDDLIQAGNMGLYEAINCYRNDRGASFKYFAANVIERRMIGAVKTDNRKKFHFQNTGVSLSSAPTGSADIAGSNTTLYDVVAASSTNDPLRLVCDREELKDLVANVPGLLSELEGRVLALYLRGRSYEQIAEILGMDPGQTKSVDNALQRVKKKIGAFLAERDQLPEQDAA